MVERGADLGFELHARDHAGGDPELPRENERLLFEMLEVSRLVRQFEMTGAGVIAIDLVDADRLLNQVEGIQRRLVALTAALGVSFEHCGQAELESRMDHPPLRLLAPYPSSFFSSRTTERPREASVAAAIIPV